MKPIQVRVSAANSPAVEAEAKVQRRSFAFVVNEALEKARKMGILRDPPKKN